MIPTEDSFYIRKNERYSKMEHKKDIGICKQLMYPQSVLEAGKNEPDAYKRQNIMADARRKY